MGQRRQGPPGRGRRGGPAPRRFWTGPLGKRERSWGRGQVSALSTLLSLRTVVEVTGHAHVLLAAFEKVSAVVPLAWE